MRMIAHDATGKTRVVRVDNEGYLVQTPRGRPTLGYGEVVVGIAAVALPAVPAGATVAYISAEATVASGVSETLRFRVDGGTPTGTSGHELEDRERLVLDNPQQIANFRAIRDGAATADGKVSVTYF